MNEFLPIKSEAGVVPRRGHRGPCRVVALAGVGLAVLVVSLARVCAWGWGALGPRVQGCVRVMTWLRSGLRLVV